MTATRAKRREYYGLEVCKHPVTCEAPVCYCPSKGNATMQASELDFEQRLGKITKATYGIGGYDDTQFGLTLEFKDALGCVGHFNGFWIGKPSSNAEWTTDDQTMRLGGTALALYALLCDAKKTRVEELVGVPVQLTFKGQSLIAYRILTEVL